MNKACIIGLGLLGGSLAKALREKAGFSHIMAIGRNEAAMAKARDDGAIDGYSTDIRDIWPDTDIVFICTPVGKAIELLKELGGFIPPSCIITDVGSTKGTIMQAAEEMALGQFIGGHPMAGSEKSGYAASNPLLFENAFYILTSSQLNKAEDVEGLKALVEKLGAIPVPMDAERHDHAVAAISHLPHVLAAGLVNTVEAADDEAGHMHTLAAGGFKDLTRIASSDADMWQSICLENGPEIVALLEQFKQQLQQFQRAIEDGDGGAIGALFQSARTYRNSFAQRSNPYLKTYKLTVDIADKPGAIATIATVLSLNGINLRNIGIIHNREHQGGVLEVLFETEKGMRQAHDLLLEMNYIVYANE